jgi:hypothetical protein
MELKHNKIMTFGGPQRTSKGPFVDDSRFDPSKRAHAGETISRNTQWYRMWWTYLRLALELESLGWRIRVNRRYYLEWNIDSILGNSFDNWWKGHKQLFVVESIKKESDPASPDDDHIVMRIPKNRDKTSVLRELDRLLEGKIKSEERFPFSNSKATYLRLHMQYNIFIKHFHGPRRESRESIRTWVNETYRPLSSHLLQTKFDNQGKRITEIVSAENGITNNVRYARKRILSVGQGVFP